MKTTQRLLYMLTLGSSATSLLAADPPSLLLNGHFDGANQAEAAKGWEFPDRGSQERQGVTAGVTFFSEVPGGPFVNSWLALSARQADSSVTASYTVTLPPGTRRVKLSGRFRVDKVTVAPEPNWAGIFIGGAILGADKKRLNYLSSGVRYSKPTNGWEKKESIIELPEGSAFIQLQPGIYHSSGDFALDDLELVALPAK